jgi:hypothetical protein
MRRAASNFEAKWIDVHAHFMVPQTEDQLRRTAVARCERCFLAPELYQWTPEAALEHMDRNGIVMQLLSNIPKSLKALRESNEHGASIVARYPARFGLLLALPTNDPDACLAEIDRREKLNADGYAVTCRYNDVYLSDSRLEPVCRFVRLGGRHLAGRTLFDGRRPYQRTFTLGRTSARRASCRRIRSAFNGHGHRVAVKLKRRRATWAAARSMTERQILSMERK